MTSRGRTSFGMIGKGPVSSEHCSPIPSVASTTLELSYGDNSSPPYPKHRASNIALIPIVFDIVPA